AGSKPACPVSIPIPGPRDLSQSRPPFHSVLRKSALFLLACRRADIALRRQSFETVVSDVEIRKRRGRADSPAPGRAVRLAAVFDALRPIYPRPYLCTFDSLALVHFLAYHRLHARWVFGVRADPFYAHCWVQYGDTLLNDAVERVLPLTPIMAV
ncbi:MAG: lasso peptide biosynthesis B2 protein, partial [Steroidobacteraceae bacterium]